MTPEEQRITIAKAVGYRDGETKPFWLATPIGKTFKACAVEDLPDYLNDLNAMHEAEESRWNAAKFRVMYSAMLSGLFKHDDIGAYHATAAQRAEAFLRTLNLWKATP